MVLKKKRFNSGFWFAALGFPPPGSKVRFWHLIRKKMCVFLEKRFHFFQVDRGAKKMRSAICYRMKVSRGPGAPCGSGFGCFCFSIFVFCFLFTKNWYLFIFSSRSWCKKDAQRDLLPNERLETSRGALWLGIRAFWFFYLVHRTRRVWGKVQ